MRIVIKTEVEKPLKEVFSAFDEKLFLKLSPPFPPVKLLRFDGCKPKDEVHLELSFILFKQQWVSFIVSANESANEIYFIDEGIKLPFFLKKWKHKHLLQKQNSNTVIIDDIQYTTGFLITDAIVFPLLFLQFLYRKPIYKKYFSIK